MIQGIHYFCHRHHKPKYLKPIKVDISSESQQEAKNFGHTDLTEIPIPQKCSSDSSKPIYQNPIHQKL